MLTGYFFQRMLVGLMAHTADVEYDAILAIGHDDIIIASSSDEMRERARRKMSSCG